MRIRALCTAISVNAIWKFGMEAPIIITDGIMNHL